MTLSDRLREAAFERASAVGNVYEQRVLDEDGVIDLRVTPHHPDDAASKPAESLNDLAGHLAAAARAVDHLYSDATDRPGRRGFLGRLRRRPDDVPDVIDLRDNPDAPPVRDLVAETNELAEQEPTPPLPAVADDSDAGIAVKELKELKKWSSFGPLKSRAEFETVELPEAEIGPSLTVGQCPKCLVDGNEDQFDPFKQIHYLSCPSCFYMWQESRG